MQEQLDDRSSEAPAREGAPRALPRAVAGARPAIPR